MAADAADWQFGDYLRSLRSRLGLSLGQVLIRLRGIGIDTDRSTLHRYETGERRSPDAVILWGLARVYRRPVAEMVEALAAATLERSPAPTEQVVNRLTEEQIREEKVLQYFRAASAGVQREILEWMEFKASRTRGGGGETATQRDAAPRSPSFRARRRPRPAR
jgi:transcriptional regulator with XRE-family HTH domain